MSAKSERWAWQRIRELEEMLRQARRYGSLQHRRAELWRQRALRRPVKK